MTKTYNVAAFGITASLVEAVAKLGNSKLPLTYTRHALRAAMDDRYGALPPSAFPTRFEWAGNWTIVECEADDRGALVKFVVRREVDVTRSLVLVILAGGTVKTLWVNRNSDMPASLDSSKFSRP